MSEKVYSINHVPQPKEPKPEGTLIQQAEQIKPKPKTKYARLAEKMNRTAADVVRRFPARMSSYPQISNQLADVESFNHLIDDRVVNFNQLRAEIDEQQRLRIVTQRLGQSKQGHPDLADEVTGFSMQPTGSFWRSLGAMAGRNYADSKKPIVKRLSLETLRSMQDGNPRMRQILVDLTNEIFLTLDRNYRDNKRNRKEMLLRTLRPDPNGRRWPKFRSARALLHPAFREDLSHVWLMRLLAELAPTGHVTRYMFDGNLLKGAILLPDIVRTEKDSDYSGGLFFWSGEVGDRKVGVQPFVYRAITEGVALFGKPWAVAHHTAGKLDALRRSMREYIGEQIPLVSLEMDRLVASQQIKFDENSDRYAIERLIIALKHQFDLTQQEMKLWRLGIISERNLVPGIDLSVFTLQNGLTIFSQTLEDPTRQIRVDQFAGRLLGLDWDKIVARAETISDEAVEAVFPQD